MNKSELTETDYKYKYYKYKSKYHLELNKQLNNDQTGGALHLFPGRYLFIIRETYRYSNKYIKYDNNRYLENIVNECIHNQNIVNGCIYKDTQTSNSFTNSFTTVKSLVPDFDLNFIQRYICTGSYFYYINNRYKSKIIMCRNGLDELIDINKSFKMGSADQLVDDSFESINPNVTPIETATPIDTELVDRRSYKVSNGPDQASIGINLENNITPIETVPANRTWYIEDNGPDQASIGIDLENNITLTRKYIVDCIKKIYLSFSHLVNNLYEPIVRGTSTFTYYGLVVDIGIIKSKVIHITKVIFTQHWIGDIIESVSINNISHRSIYIPPGTTWCDT